MGFSLDFNTFFNIIMTAAMTYICYSLKQRDDRNEKRHEKHEKAIEEIKQTYVTKEEHYRDINSLDKKIDDIKCILMDIQKDIGRLIGKSGGNK